MADTWKGYERYVVCSRCKTSRPSKEIVHIVDVDVATMKAKSDSVPVCAETGWCSEQAKRLGLILGEAFASPVERSTAVDVEKPPPPIPSPSTPDLGGES